MGGGSWTTASYNNYMKSSRGIDNVDKINASTVNQFYTTRHLDPALDPKGIKIRECRDSEEHPTTIPVILGLDVTGSMGSACAAVARQLDKIITGLYADVKDVEFMVMGIGDFAYDDAPLQVSQFESDVRICDQLGKIWFERGGGVQRGHTANGQVVHCTGTGDLAGGTTYYDEHFVVDPIALWITGTKVFIHPMCRVVLPCDIVRNRKKEIERGLNKHGSCGMGIFECVKRNRYSHLRLRVKDLADTFMVYELLARTQRLLAGSEEDEVYSIDNFMRAVEYLIRNCPIVELSQIAADYDTLIFEGGQGLLLDQANVGDFPHLTPSSVGSYNIHNTINKLGADSTDIFYISRSYMTRHGVGPMDAECSKDDINSDIVDATNIRNDWQDELRFGYIDTEKLYRRVRSDFSRYDNAKLNMVFTQLNYTDGRIATGRGKFEDIILPDFVDGIYLSDQKDVINKHM